MIKQLKKHSGIYMIKCLANGKFYIGSAVCLYTRGHVHFSLLNHKKHDNRHLQRLFNKHGVNSFVWGVIELCQKDQLIEREQHYIDLYNPSINICRNAANTLGVKHTAETKEYLSLIRKGRNISYLKGLNHTEDARRKISEKAKARGLHPNFLAASKAANTGRKHDPLFRKRLAEVQSKITPEQAAEIIELRSAGIYQKDIAKRFGISQRLVVRVEHGIGIYGNPEYKNQKSA